MTPAASNPTNLSWKWLPCNQEHDEFDRAGVGS